MTSGSLKLLTQNLYLGADIGTVLSASSLDEIPARVDAIYELMLATDFPVRAKALARAIAGDPPDLIGLQEVACWQAQTAPGNSTGNLATLETTDFLALLLSELTTTGLEYEVAAVSANGRVELPSRSRGQVRLQDRDVILVRTGVPVTASGSENFRSQASVRIGGEMGPQVSFNRGWTWVDVAANEHSIRFVNTHLELPGSVQRKQMREIVRWSTSAGRPVVVAGDFNANPDNGNGAFHLQENSEFSDVWRTLRSGEAGHTGCQAPDLSNETSQLSKRLDVILCSRGLAPLEVNLLGADAACRVRSHVNGSHKLWPSDHAGVRALLGVG